MKPVFSLRTHVLTIACSVAVIGSQFSLLTSVRAQTTIDAPPESAAVDPSATGEQAEVAEPSVGTWCSLFNGKDMAGWTSKFVGQQLGENWRNTFRVEDGLLKVRYDRWEGEFDREFGHLFYEKPFSRYRLRVEYRFVGEQVAAGPKYAWARRNNGLMIHGQDPATMELDQSFPDSIEVQLLGGLDDDQPRSTLNLCTPGTHVVIDGKLIKKHCISSSSPTFAGDQWVTVEVEVLGNEVIRHIVGGKTVLEYNQPQLDDGTMLSAGTISVQAETAPIDFRKIEIMLLE